MYKTPKFSFTVLVLFIVIAAIKSLWPFQLFAMDPEKKLSLHREKKSITVAYCNDSPPFHYQDESGQPAGLLIDYWKLWSEKTWITIIFKPAAWDETLELVKTGQVDAHAGLFYSKERDEYLLYSEPISKTDTHLFYHKTLPAPQDVKDAVPYRVGVISKDFVEGYIKEKAPRAALVPFQTYDEMMESLRNGELKMFAADTLTGLYKLQKSGLAQYYKYRSTQPLYQNNWFFAVAEGREDLIRRINSGLALITRDERLLINRSWAGGTKSGEAGDLIVAIDSNYPPFSLVGPDGNPTGLLVEMWELWSKAAGIPIRFRPSSWAETIEAVKNGEADVHFGLFINEERKEWLNFSSPLHEIRTALYFRAGQGEPLSLAELAGQKVGVLKGSFQEAWLRSKYPNLEVIDYIDGEGMVIALIKGEIAAIVHEVPGVEAAVNMLGLKGALIRGEDLFGNTVHAGVRRDRPLLLKAIENGFSMVDREKLAELDKRWIANPEDRYYHSVTSKMRLTEEENAFLQSHPKIRIGVMAAWPPMNFVDDTGQPSGLGADYVKALNLKLDGVLEIEPGPFKENLEQVKSRKLDALMDVTPKPEREEFLNFTRSYLAIPHVIVARQDGPYYGSETELNGKTLALETGFYNVKYFRQKYPGVKVEEYPNTAMALDAVSRGKADAYAGNRAVANWILEKELISNLQVQGRLSKPSAILAIGVRKDWPELASILDKALASMSVDEVRAIHRRWAGLGAEETADQRLVLTDEEKSWLKAHQKLRLGIDPTWPPVEFFNENKEYVGIASGFVKAMEKKLGLTFDPALGLSWPQVIEGLKNKDLDAVAAVARTPEREDYLVFTKPYVTFPAVVVTQKDAPFVSEIGDLAGKKVGVIEGYAVQGYLKDNFPGIRIEPRSNLTELLRSISVGELDAVVCSLAAVTYGIDHQGITNLRIAATTDFSYKLSMGVRKDWPELALILDKAFDAMTAAEKAEIKNRWVSIQYIQGLKLRTVLKWAIPIAAGLMVILSVIILWNRRLGREVAERKRAEEQLLESEKKTRAMSEAVHDGLIMIDGRAKVMYWNQAAEKLFRIPADEALGKDIHTLFVPEEYREQARAGLKVFAETGQGPVVGKIQELTALRSDGARFPVEVGVSAFQVGNKWYAVGTVRDITERKQIEEQIKATREELLLIFNNSQVGIMFMHGDCQLARVNRGLAEILEYEVPKEMIGFSMSQLHLSEERFQAFKKSNHDVLCQGKQSKVEYQLRKKDGSAVWCSMSGKAVDTASPPDLSKGVIWVVDDISRRKRIEDDLRESEERSRLVLESAGEGIFGVDASGHMTFVNPAAIHMLGYTKEELHGQDVHQLIHHTHADGAPYPIEDCPISASCQQGTIHQVADEVLWRKDGSSFFAEYSCTPMHKNGGVIGAVVTFRDVTERKKVEEELNQHLEDLERFNRLVIGREEKMIDLKSEINDLLGQSGQGKKYKIVE